MTHLRWWAMLGVLAGAVTILALPFASATAATAGTSARAAVILLDTNASWPPSRIAAERQAVLSYADALPADVHVGLITFGDRWRMALSPATDRGRLAAALTASHAAGATSMGLAGALSQATSAIHALHPSAERLVVFSDAEMLTGPPPAVTVPTDVVIWHYESDDHTGLLRTLASSSGGRIASPANAAALAAAFPAVAQGGAPASAAPQPGALSLSLILPLAAIFAALMLVTVVAVGSLSRRERRLALEGQIERYGPRHSTAPAKQEEGRLARAVVGATGQLLQSSNSERGLAQRLDLAGITRTPAEWTVLSASCAAVLAVVLTLLIGNPVLGVPAGVLAGWLAMRLVVSLRIGRRRAAFAEQLPDLLQLIAASLRSGFSLPQALDSVVREDAKPASGEFSRALAEVRIGAELEDALDGVAIRMDSNDMRWTVMAIRIQRQVGGNLAEVLYNTVGTMRERAYLRRQVRTLSAEGRLSAYILSVLPPVVGGWFFYIDPTYMRPLYTTFAGVVLLVVTLVLYSVGVLWMRKLVKVVV